MTGGQLHILYYMASLQIIFDYVFVIDGFGTFARNEVFSWMLCSYTCVLNVLIGTINYTRYVQILIVIIIIRHELGLNRRVSASHGILLKVHASIPRTFGV